jgi:hypothetical protein
MVCRRCSRDKPLQNPWAFYEILSISLFLSLYSRGDAVRDYRPQLRALLPEGLG